MISDRDAQYLADLLANALLTKTAVAACAVVALVAVCAITWRWIK